MAKNIDWIAIKNEYINTNLSYRDLAEKYSVSKSQISNKGKEENWKELRKEQRDKIGTKLGQKTADKIVEEKIDLLSRINSAAENLLNKIEEATEQLNNHIVKNKYKTRIIEYNNEERPDKPTKEVIDEKEEIELVIGDIDRKGLEQVASSLKMLKDIVKESSPNGADDQINNSIQDIAELINNPKPNRNIKDYEDE